MILVRFEAGHFMLIQQFFERQPSVLFTTYYVFLLNDDAGSRNGIIIGQTVSFEGRPHPWFIER